MLDKSNKYTQLAISTLMATFIASLGFGFSGTALMIFPYFFMGNSIQIGIVPALLSMLVSTGIVALFYGPMAGASLFLVFAPVVLIFHYCITTDRSSLVTFLSMAAVLLISMTTVSASISGGVQVTPEELTKQMMALQEDLTGQFSDLELSRLETRLKTMLEFIALASPAITIIGVLIVTYLNYTMTGRNLFLRGVLINQPPPLMALQIPRGTLLLAGLVLGIGAILQNQGMDPKGIMILNGLLVFGFLYMVNGLATINLFVLLMGIPLFLRVIIYVLLFRIPILNTGMMILGLVDSLFGIRSRVDG